MCTAHSLYTCMNRLIVMLQLLLCHLISCMKYWCKHSYMLLSNTNSPLDNSMTWVYKNIQISRLEIHQFSFVCVFSPPPHKDKARHPGKLGKTCSSLPKGSDTVFPGSFLLTWPTTNIWWVSPSPALPHPSQRMMQISSVLFFCIILLTNYANRHWWKYHTLLLKFSFILASSTACVLMVILWMDFAVVMS